MATEALVLNRPIAPVQGSGLSLAHSANARTRIDLGGVLIDHLDANEAVRRIRGFLSAGQSHHIVTVNLDFLAIAQGDSQFRAVLNQADLAVADGMPLVWASRMRGQALPERVAGVDLVDRSCQLAAEMGQSVFLLGAAPGVADEAGQVLQARYPGLRIAGTYSPPVGPLSDKENTHIIRRIRDAAPAFLFVALGAPRQDLWIAANRHRLNVPVSMGVGCVFDVLAGVVDRAPVWMRHAGLEWAYRLGREPGRLWRRYLVNDSRMMAHLVFEALRGGDTRSDPLAALP